MEKNHIQYQDLLKKSFSDLSELNGSFGKIVDIQISHKPNKNIEKTSKTKSSMGLPLSSSIKTVFQFDLSIELLNLLRKPLIQKYSLKGEYVRCIKFFCQKYYKDWGVLEEKIKLIILYIHIILSKVENLDHMNELKTQNQPVCQLDQNIEFSNIINAPCLLQYIEKIQLEQFPEETERSENFKIHIIENPSFYEVSEKSLYISCQYVEKALNSQGYLDIHFGAFFTHKLNFNALLSYFRYCQEFLQMQTSYAQHYYESFQNQKQKVNYEEWYKIQVNKLINGNFSIDDLKNKITEGQNHPLIQKFLIGLHGWNQPFSEEAVVLLNAYYDQTDWQITSPLKPIVSQIGQKFGINYLIQNIPQHRQNTLLCLKAPCFDNNYHKQVFSWHHARIRYYKTQEQTYLWIELDLGSFQKCGFYDWKAYQIGSDGVNHQINKIVNISDNKKLGSKLKQKNIYNLKPVQGRIIVHPQQSKKLQIHEIYMDSLSSQEKSKRVPHFTDAIEDIQKYAEDGINCVYLMGVFERDNGKFNKGYKRPEASPMALTCRKTPCKMLGGPSNFKKLMNKSSKLGVKIITDCTTRVSSSRMNKRYEDFILEYLDQTGKKYPYYGSVGRSINYQQTAILNYRKLQTWNLLIDEVTELVNEFSINGVYLDEGFSWPQIFQADHEQLLRQEDEERIYSDQEIFSGKIIIKNRQTGYWTTTKAYQRYPNPFLIKICKTLWERHPNFLIMCDGFHMGDNDERLINVIQSGPIPRLFKMVKALAQIMGIGLQQNGTITSIKQKNANSLKKWYQEVQNHLPKNSIIIQSTTSHNWPYPAYLFKKATWAVIDLFFFLPEMPMTFIGQDQGKAYRTKTTSIFFSNSNNYENKEGKVTKFKKSNSSFFDSDIMISGLTSVVSSVNATVRDPAQIQYLQNLFRKDVGPEYGFDLKEIKKHYNHRRKLRSSIQLLTSGKMVSVTAQHMYGIHKNVLSFAKWNEKEIIIIAINFNSSEIDMHFNLYNLKYIFTNAKRSNLVLKVSDILGQSGLQQTYYTVSQLLASKIEAHLKAYSSIIWKLTIQRKDKLQDAFECSRKRLKGKICSEPPKWIYSSIFTNQLSYIATHCESLKSFVTGFSRLYQKFIEPDQLNFNLIISKTHQFWINKVKLSKLFGIFKLIQKHPSLNETLRTYIKALIEGNTLGPIAFVTPEIGSWSSVGGLGVMVDELSKQLVKLGEQVYIVTPYYEYNKKKQTNYLQRDGFYYDRNIKTNSSHLQYQFGIHQGKRNGVNFIWLHNPQLFSRPYDGQGALYVTKQLVFFALSSLQAFCQLKIFPSLVVTNDWMCGFVSAYVKVGKFESVFSGTKFMHICHNLDPLYEGRLYPKFEEGNLNWLIQLPSEWYVEYRNNKLIINPSKCALQTCDNWGTVSNSYKYDLLKESPLAPVLWKHPNPFSFPNGVRKDERVSIIQTKTPGSHKESKKILQQKYFQYEELNDQIPLFSFIGRVTKQKGVHLIVDSIESLLHQFNFKIQFLVGGVADSKQQYGRYCAERMKYLNKRYPKCFWSNPDLFFTDGALANIGSDFALMPSLFQPGGIVQHEFFCGSTPVIAFRTGGLKDTVFEYSYETKKGNGFNFMSYDLQDFKKCMRRAINCYKDKSSYERLRENAFDSVVEEEDVAKGWNNEFYRLQNKIYIDWNLVEKEILLLKNREESFQEEEGQIGEKGQFWSQSWEIKKDFKKVLINAQRIQGKLFTFLYQTDKIPRPKEVFIVGSWDQWNQYKKMKYDPYKKLWTISFKLKPGTYSYKYFVDNEWVLTKNSEIETDMNNNENHIIVVD